MHTREKVDKLGIILTCAQNANISHETDQNVNSTFYKLNVKLPFCEQKKILTKYFFLNFFNKKSDFLKIKKNQIFL